MGREVLKIPVQTFEVGKSSVNEASCVAWYLEMKSDLLMSTSHHAPEKISNNETIFILS